MTVQAAVPQADPRASYLAHRVEIDQAIARVLAGGRYILGPETQAFEQEFAAYVGVGHGIGVGSGTEALHLALTACGVGPGDEVISVSHTAVATVAAIELSGATPVLVDIDPATYTLDPQGVQAAITPRTTAIVPVHLYGHPADMAALLSIARPRGLRVVEDCAQSHGAMWAGKRTGAWGDAAAFSFYPTKNLGGLGDGGMVVTDDPGVAERARLLRQYGWRDRYVSAVPGWNSRLDELQAAILRVKLAHLDSDNGARQALAGRYAARLAGAGLGLPGSRGDAVHVYHLYVVRDPRREDLRAHLAGQGIGTGIHYPVPVHLQPAYRGRLGRVGSLPQSERAAAEVLSLPLFPELHADRVEAVAAAVLAWARRGAGR